ncbi:MAG: hypothetical protein VYB09_08485 [Planctomycetota bacterium]|nr:hypothetical protein [Planctomycetota bacterium]
MNELVPFECPYCSHQMEIREGLDGKDGTCSGCNRMVTFSLSSWQSGEGRHQAEDGSPPGPPPPAGAATFPPGPPSPLAGPPPLMSDTLYRKGNLLAFHKYAPLPGICLKSNQPATQQLKRNLSWHPPVVYIGLLLGLIPFIILALVLSKKATIYIGLTDEWAAIRKRKIARGWGIMLLSIALGIGILVMGLTNLMPRSLGALACFTGIGSLILFFIGLWYASFSANVVPPARITTDFVYLKGVHPDFLARLPEWPFPDNM